MPVIDHALRAARLTTFTSDLEHLNDDCYDVAGVEPGRRMPHRYVCATFSGRDSWLVFTDDIEEARLAQQEAACQEEPWSPGDVMDLDTGVRYETWLHATLVRYTHQVTGALPGQPGQRLMVVGETAAAAVAQSWREIGYVDIDVTEATPPDESNQGVVDRADGDRTDATIAQAAALFAAVKGTAVSAVSAGSGVPVGYLRVTDQTGSHGRSVLIAPDGTTRLEYAGLADQ